MSYIDLHCDTLMKTWLSGFHRLQDLNSGDAVILPENLEENHCIAQFFAIFLLPRDAYHDITGQKLISDDLYINQCVQILNASCDSTSSIRIARNQKELKENLNRGKVSAFLTLEDGRALTGNIDKLQQYYNLGIRLISLTWNDPNCIGWPNSRNCNIMNKGLTPFGIELVEAMNDLGILIDVSHLSDGGFWDVAKYSKKPFLASHSNCRALIPHPRNLTDEMIRCIAERGGIIGVNFTPEFLSSDPGAVESDIQAIVAQLLHLKNTGGIDCAAIGSDFDGMESAGGVTSPDQLYMLWAELKRTGFSENEIDAISKKNALRMIEQL